MKILSITAQKPHSTGSGTYLTELVRSWSRAGCRQAVVCGIYPDDEVDFPEGTACYPVFFTDTQAPVSSSSGSLPPHRVIPFAVTGMSDIMPYTSTRYRDLTPEMISMFEDAFTDTVRRAVDELDPDLIVCHHLFLLTALVARQFPDRRIYGISHGTDLRQMRNCPELAEYVRPYIPQTDMVLALHEDQKQQIHELFGIEYSRIRVIGSGYNGALFNTSGRRSRGDASRISGGEEEPVTICYAGKMSRPKGVPEMLRALEMLSDDPDVPPFRAILAGGCQDPAVQTLLDRLPGNISWIGQVSQTRLAEIFRSGDIFVLPSYFEGLPLVLIEAMASGMIPVSTDLPGVRGWIQSRVPDNNIHFVPMPEMASIDQPTESGRLSLTEDLYSEISGLIKAVSRGDLPGSTPDTSGITWDSVASDITGLL